MLKAVLVALVLWTTHALGDISFDPGFTPSERCAKHFAAFLAKYVAFSVNGEPARVHASPDLSKVHLQVGDQIFRDPVSVLTELVAESPEAAADPVFTEAVEHMKNPVDPSGFAVLCLSGACAIQDNAEGVHQAVTPGLFRGDHSAPDLETAYRLMRGAAAKSAVPVLESQVLGTKLPAPESLQGNSGPLLGWYATVLHETSHVATERLIVDWVAANRKRLVEGNRPDDLFLRYVKLHRGNWVLDNTFYMTLTEGLAYSVTGKAFDLLAKARKEEGLDENWSNQMFNVRPFEKFTGQRSGIKDELGLSASNWWGRAREIRGDMQKTIDSAK